MSLGCRDQRRNVAAVCGDGTYDPGVHLTLLSPRAPPADIKKEFDKKYGPTWHCIVGRNFGSYVTHETKNFIYFYLGQVAVLLFSE